MSQRKIQLPPAIPHLPLLGNLLDLQRDPLALLQRVSQEDDMLRAFHFGPRLVPVLHTPELIRNVLIEQAAHFEKTATVRRLGQPVIGDGLFLSEGQEHRRKRKLLAPLFQPHRVLENVDQILAVLLHVCETWMEGDVIDVVEAMRRLSLWMICSALFGSTIAEVNQTVGAPLTMLFRYFTYVITHPVQLPSWCPTPQRRQVRHVLSQLDGLIAHLIQKQRLNPSSQAWLSSFLSFHDHLAAPALSEQHLREEVLSLFIAGHETTANGLAWSWYLLSQHPDVYRRLQAECDRVLAGRLPTVADLPRLPYALQVFKEALRLFPPAYVLTRGATHPVQLGSYHIPRGTSVVISPYSLHRRARYFPHPDRFDPDRFAPGCEQHIPIYAYLPFSAGAHACLGKHFALLEGQLTLVTLAQRITFERVGAGTITPEPLLTLRPKGALWMRVHYR